MKSMSASLGADCELCHKEDDFSADTLAPKARARQMMTMRLAINRGYFGQAGAKYSDKTTWEELLDAGAKLKAAGHPFCIAYAQTPDSNDNLYPIMASFGAYMFDKEGKISFRRKEITDALNYGKQFFEKTMTDEVLSWDDSSNNRFIASGKGSLICNPISAYRTAAKDNPDVYRTIEDRVRRELGLARSEAEAAAV